MSGDSFVKLWTDINRELWRSACENSLPRNFIRAELWRRIDHARHLEKSSAVRLMRRSKPVSAVYRACLWIVQSGPINPDPLSLPTDTISLEENAAIPTNWPCIYPGIDTNQAPQPLPPHSPIDHYDLFVYAFVYAAQAASLIGLDLQTISLEFTLSSQLWSYKGTDHNPFGCIRINFIFIGAPPKIWNALFAAIVKRHTPSRRVAEQYALSDEARRLRAVYADIAPLRSHDVYDLSALFDDLNARFFNQALPKPTLSWTARPQYRTLGAYDFHWHIIRISRALNDKRVPPFVIEFVLYHEMLHIKHGAHRANNRLISHTQAFRADEKQFPLYDEAQLFSANLKANLAKNPPPSTP